MSDVKTIEQAPIEQTPQPIPEVVQKQYDHLVETIRAYNPGADFAQIDAAFHYAAAHHGAQKRKDGSPFVTHPIAVAQIVAEELHLDSESIIAALLHDCIEDTDATYDDIAKRFSPTVADLVEGVSKLTRVQNVGDDPMVAQDLRRPRRRAIEEAASVFCPVRAEAVDLQGQPIVQVSAHRPPHDGDARQMAVRHAAQGKLMPSHRLMVAVVLCDKPVCVGKGHRFYSQHRLRLHQLYGGLP